VTSGEALQLVRQLVMELSAPIHPRMIQEPPQVVQVWFAPGSTATAAPTPTPVLTMHGNLKLDGPVITFQISDADQALRTIFRTGGQILIRVHCGYLADERDLPVSATPDAAAGFKNPVPLFGGIFESWFFVRG
jgi:hypothetical protein